MATCLGNSPEGTFVGGDTKTPWGALCPCFREEHAYVHERHVLRGRVLMDYARPVVEESQRYGEVAHPHVHEPASSTR